MLYLSTNPHQIFHYLVEISSLPHLEYNRDKEPQYQIYYMVHHLSQNSISKILRHQQIQQKYQFPELIENDWDCCTENEQLIFSVDKIRTQQNNSCQIVCKARHYKAGVIGKRQIFATWGFKDSQLQVVVWIILPPLTLLCSTCWDHRMHTSFLMIAGKNRVYRVSNEEWQASHHPSLRSTNLGSEKRESAENDGLQSLCLLLDDVTENITVLNQNFMFLWKPSSKFMMATWSFFTVCSILGMYRATHTHT